MVKKGDRFNIEQVCPESGVYRLVQDEGRSEDQKEIPLTKGEKFPPCRNCTGKVTWEFVRKA